jgi:hypothetical protein
MQKRMEAAALCSEFASKLKVLWTGTEELYRISDDAGEEICESRELSDARRDV